MAEVECSRGKAFFHGLFNARVAQHRPGGEVVTLGTANPTCAGSIPAQASNLFAGEFVDPLPILLANVEHKIHRRDISEYCL